MKRVVVTGGTGFLGSHVVEHLVERGGAAVRVLARAPSPRLTELGVEVALGDLVREMDFTGGPPSEARRPKRPLRSIEEVRPSLERALEGCEELYHLAGFVSRDPRDGQRMMRVHVDGTRRVLTAAKAAGVKRVVLASTSGTIAVSREPEPILDETAPYPIELVGGWPYYLSKIYQEKLALELGRSLGIEMVVVNPSLLLGPGDVRQSSTGDVLRFLRRELPVVPDGGVSFVDARDAALATVAAMERGRTGERYLLGGPNWTCREFFGRLERASKVRAPRLRLPAGLLRGAAILVEEAYRALEREAPVDRISVEMSQAYWYCDSSRAARELGFAARDPAETLDATLRDLRARMI